jgi:hypothetical protein
MNSDQRAGADSQQNIPQDSAQAANRDRRKAALEDPRAVDILTTEHWGLLSSRTLGYQEMFNRTTIFVSVLSATVIALALLAQANQFGRVTLWFALLLMSVALFVGLATFVRSVAINYEDATWVMGIDLVRRAYLQMVPELEAFFLGGQALNANSQPLGHGAQQRFENVARSLTTTSSVVAALNSIVAGALASDLGALSGAGMAVDAILGVAVSLVSAVVHVRYAARFRESHPPSSNPAPPTA